MGNSIKNIKKTNLNIFKIPEGDVLHAIHKSDPYLRGFGEVYFSKINAGHIKGWKRHMKMTLNLVVPVGNVLFAFVDSEGVTRHEIIGENNYIKLMVPPLIWFAFKGIDTPYSLIMNFADIPHDPQEVERKELNQINFNWEYLK